MAESRRRNVTELRAELGDLFGLLATLTDGDEVVDELAHALQCAGSALIAGAEDELVVACSCTTWDGH